MQHFCAPAIFRILWCMPCKNAMGGVERARNNTGPQFMATVNCPFDSCECPGPGGSICAYRVLFFTNDEYCCSFQICLCRMITKPLVSLFIRRANQAFYTVITYLLQFIHDG